MQKFEHGGGLDSVQQHALVGYGLLECYNIGYVSCRQRQMAVQVLQQILQESVQPKSFHVCGTAECMCHCSGTQKRPCMLMSRSFKASFKVVLSQISL